MGYVKAGIDQFHIRPKYEPKSPESLISGDLSIAATKSAETLHGARNGVWGGAPMGSRTELPNGVWGAAPTGSGRRPQTGFWGGAPTGSEADPDSK